MPTRTSDSCICASGGWGIQESWISEARTSRKDATDVGTVALCVGQPCQRSKWYFVVFSRTEHSAIFMSPVDSNGHFAGTKAAFATIVSAFVGHANKYYKQLFQQLFSSLAMVSQWSFKSFDVTGDVCCQVCHHCHQIWYGANWSGAHQHHRIIS